MSDRLSVMSAVLIEQLGTRPRSTKGPRAVRRRLSRLSNLLPATVIAITPTAVACSKSVATSSWRLVGAVDATGRVRLDPTERVEMSNGAASSAAISCRGRSIA